MHSICRGFMPIEFLAKIYMRMCGVPDAHQESLAAVLHRESHVCPCLPSPEVTGAMMIHFPLFAQMTEPVSIR